MAGMKIDGWWTVVFVALCVVALFACLGIFMAADGCRLWPDVPGCGTTGG